MASSSVSSEDRGKLNQFTHFRFSSLTKEEGAHKADECEHGKPPEQVCLSGGDIYDDPSLLRSQTSTRNPPYPIPPKPMTVDHAEGTVRKEGPEVEEPSIVQDGEDPQSITFYHPSKSSNVPFPSRLKKQKKDDDDE
ncbi:hypothetical protein Tco_1255274 [Tanacetum coccineum]